MEPSNRLVSTIIRVIATVLALTIASGTASFAAGLEETRTFSGERLRLRSLVGEVHVESYAGADFEVQVTIAGRDARPGIVHLEATEDQLDILLPAGSGDLVYPHLGPGSKTDFDLHRGGGLAELFYGEPRTDRLQVRASGDGLELWTDVTVRVPSGGELEVEHGVGSISAKGTDGRLELSTHSGDVSIERTTGELSVATGSGQVGLLRIDSQKVEVATGSGAITVEECRGGSMELATGSGAIRLDGLQASELEVGTGSGDVRARGIDADDVEVGTGSGTVEVELARASSGKYELGAGSGDVLLTVPAGSSAEVRAETSSGEIEIDLPDAEFLEHEKDEVRVTVGGGDARIEIGTGSGDIRVRS